MSTNLTLKQKRTYYSLLLLCCLVILAIPFWLSRRYGLAPDWSLLSVLKFLLAAGGGIGFGLVVVTGGGWLASAAAKAPLAALMGTAVVGTGIFATAIILPAPKADGAQQAILSADRSLLASPKPDSAQQDSPKVSMPSATLVPTDETDAATTEDAQNQETNPNLGEETLPKVSKANETPTQEKSLAREEPTKTPAVVSKPIATKSTYKRVELGEGYYALVIEETQKTDIRKVPVLSADLEPLGGWRQTGAGQPYLFFIGKERQAFVPEQAEHAQAVAKRMVRLGKVDAISFVTEHEAGGYLVEYWVYYGKGQSLCKVYDPRVYDSVKAALASKPAFRAP